MKSAIRRLANDYVVGIPNGDLHANTYLLAAPGQTGAGADCVVIDAGLDTDRIGHALEEAGWHPKAVLCTHGHFDHIGGAAWLQKLHGVPVYLMAADLKIAKLANFMMTAFKRTTRIKLPEFSLLEDDGASVEAAGRRFAFHAIPGHTPGSAGIAVDEMLFSGDSLYARHIALSRLPGEDHEQLRASLRKLFGWVGDEVLVLPGHGGSSAMAEIKAKNEELRAFMDAAQCEVRRA